MSLQIWLPLIKNLKNQGVKDSTVTASNATLSTSIGKLGGSYSFNGSSSYLLGTHDFISNSTDDWTFACWFRLNATTTGQTLFSCRTAAAASGITIFYYGSQWLIDDGARWQFTPTTTIAKDTWYHLCVIRKKGVGKFLYINGVLDSSTTTTGTPTIVNTSLYSIGLCQSGATTVSGNPLNGYINDVRFYNHALSLAEVKEISKGLIVHYQLSDMYSSDNLIVNGYGELGSENWSSSGYISTSEIPSDHSEIKASFHSGNSTLQYIPIIQNHTYTIRGFIKAMANQSGTTYPSLYAYDIDKNMIQYYQTRDGFNTTYLTTLAQPLHKGDTVIYATDLSAWTTGDNYYFHVAIFGYKDSKGYTYPDLIYTHDAPAFGTKTDKSHINKTDNTITLNSAFTGEDRPAGTTICQSTEGSTYYYPWGGITISSISDWVEKSVNFKPSNVNRLKAAVYVRWSTYAKCYIAGNKLIDNNANSNSVTDCSGYSNHGTRSGNTSISTSTPRYDLSTVFDGSSGIIEAEPLPSETLTISIWIKTSWTSSSGYRLAVHDKNTGLAIGWASNQLITYVGTANGGSGSRIDITTTNYAANKWNHIVVVKTGSTTRNVYVNGILATPSSANYWGGDLNKLNIGGRHINGVYSAFFNGQLSDFRAYATALSADDVMRLYNTAASVAKNGAMLGYEMKEV